MKFVLVLALLSTASCSHMYYYTWNLQDDLHPTYSDGNESSEEVDEAPVLPYVAPMSFFGPMFYHQPSSAVLRTGSLPSFRSATTHILPSTFGQVNFPYSAFNQQGPKLRSSEGETRSPLFANPSTPQVLPKTSYKANLPSPDLNNKKLRSSFHEKGSPLSPEVSSSRLLPTAFKKVNLPRSSRRMDGLKLRSAFHEQGSPLSPSASVSSALPSPYKKVNI
ncbi:uncharacterized protein [Panulirus ornatus]|uniref:uncharacterized protein n=1 Tax=Panulirus ornatus TaxID=150431 RepID=UPI003A8385CF